MARTRAASAIRRTMAVWSSASARPTLTERLPRTERASRSARAARAAKTERVEMTTTTRRTTHAPQRAWATRASAAVPSAAPKWARRRTQTARRQTRWAWQGELLAGVRGAAGASRVLELSLRWPRRRAGRNLSGHRTRLPQRQEGLPPRRRTGLVRVGGVCVGRRFCSAHHLYDTWRRACRFAAPGFRRRRSR